MKLIPVNRKTGMQAYEGEADTIIEAFKPGTGPADTFSVIGMDGYMDRPRKSSRPRRRPTRRSPGNGGRRAV